MRSEEQLMLAYAEGDEAAFEELFARVGGLVFGYLRRGYRSPEDARDLTQQVFLHLHRSRRDFRGGSPLRPWLMTIARNVLRVHLRRERRAVLRPGFEPLDRGNLELSETLTAAIARLPVALRAIIEGRWIEHRSYEEIASRLRISHPAVKVRAHRAYRALRQLLGEFPVTRDRFA